MRFCDSVLQALPLQAFSVILLVPGVPKLVLNPNPLPDVDEPSGADQDFEVISPECDGLHVTVCPVRAGEGLQPRELIVGAVAGGEAPPDSCVRSGSTST